MENTNPFKVGDPVAFEHLGYEKTGEIIELADGKVRVKDKRGLMYRYAAENISHLGDPIVKDPKVPAQETSPKPQELQTNNTNQSTTVTMATKENVAKAAKAPKEAKPAEVSTADAATIKKIMGLTCKKHQRIFLLADSGCTKEEISKHAKANFGEISNARKMYAESVEKTAAAKALMA